MKIVLVRHGQTPANRLGALDTVRPGLGLTPEGLLQAQRLADRWESEVAPPPTVIALSGLHRTRLDRRTAGERLRLTPQVHPGIRELRSGDLEMAADRARSPSMYAQPCRGAPGMWIIACPAARADARPWPARWRPCVAWAWPLARTPGDEAVAVFVIHGALTRLPGHVAVHRH